MGQDDAVPEQALSREGKRSAPLILVVDDDRDARRLLEAFLTREGYHIAQAENAVEGLAAIETEMPDLVILDIMMPGVSGLEMLQQIRQRFQPPELPVLLLTALSDTGDVARGLEMGANDYMAKPVQTAELAARVHAQVRLKHLNDAHQAALERLRELDVLKDKFLQITAHDLKSPLGTIMMGLQILRDAAPLASRVVPEFARVIGTMGFAASTMQAIIDDYLDLEAIKAGRLQLDIHAVSVNQQVQAAAEQFRTYAESKGIALDVALDRKLPTCPADPDRLIQVIANLISNAIKFSPRGAAVRIRTRRSNGSVRVEVTDQGPGITAEDMPRLFEEFARLSNRPTGGEKSSGVGLAIARYLVEAQGGRIGVESKPGHGSVFWIELPTMTPDGPGPILDSAG